MRATALVVLVARYEREEDGSAFLADLVAKGSREERIAIARALPRLPHRVASEAADALVALGDGAMSAALAQVLAGEPNLDSRWTGVLIALLAMRKARSAARAALIEVGEAALDELERALTGRDTDPSVRRHLPRTIHRFGSPRAAQILTRALPGSEPEVRYKILRGLGRMRADDPDLPIDADALLEEAWQALARAVEMLALRVAYRRAATSAADAESSGDLLAELLEDKEHRALERVFRALHIVQPEAGFEAIFEALHSLGRAAQAGGLELIEHLVDERLRDTLLAMVGSGSEEDRLREAARTHTPERAFDLLAELPDPDRKSERESAVEPPWEAVLGALLEDGDPILSSLARHRRDELRETGTNPLDGSENGWRPPARAAGNR